MCHYWLLSKFKNFLTKYGNVCLIPAFWMQKWADSQVQGHPGLQSKFQVSQSYTKKPCLEKKSYFLKITKYLFVTWAWANVLTASCLHIQCFELRIFFFYIRLCRYMLYLPQIHPILRAEDVTHQSISQMVSSFALD